MVICWISASQHSPGERWIECSSFNSLSASNHAWKNQAKGSPSEPRTHPSLYQPDLCRLTVICAVCTDELRSVPAASRPALPQCYGPRSQQPRWEVCMFILSEPQTQILECSNYRSLPPAPPSSSVPFFSYVGKYLSRKKLERNRCFVHYDFSSQNNTS